MPRKRYMQAEVERGIKLLDDNWFSFRNRVDLDTLDMGSRSQDILGQLYGDYPDGLIQLGINKSEAHEYGFTTREDEKNFENMSYLGETWRELMYMRRRDDD